MSTPEKRFFVIPTGPQNGSRKRRIDWRDTGESGDRRGLVSTERAMHSDFSAAAIKLPCSSEDAAGKKWQEILAGIS